jgi:rhodanese-related sulfurtransferase
LNRVSADAMLILKSRRKNKNLYLEMQMGTKIRNGLAFAVLITLFIFSAAVYSPAMIENIDPEEANVLIQENEKNPDFVILDVRTPAEYSAGNLGNTINIDFYNRGFRGELDRLDRNKTYLVYCRSGNRSGRTLGVMKELGFQNVFNLRGGVLEWGRLYPLSRDN